MDFEKDIQQCLQVLQNGGVILYPTDTVWGLGCDATNAEAVAKIYAIKQRPDNKALIVLVADERDVLQYVANVDLSVFDLLNEANKPTTVIYDGAIGFADNLVAADGSIAIRIVKDDFCKHLIKRFKKPIVSTSANISGEPAASTFSVIADTIKNQVDYIVQHRQTDETPATPSAIIRVLNSGELQYLRK